MNWKSILSIVAFVFSAAHAQNGVAPPDPYVIDDSFAVGSRDTNPLSFRSPVINPALKTLVLIVAGQSNAANIVPTRIAPTNASVIDQMNIYDGALYSVRGDLLGCSNDDTHGNMNVQLADKFISNGIFNRVIIADIAISTTTIAQWSTGTLSTRIPVIMRRLAAAGITPSTTGVTFAFLWEQGESDSGTAQATYQSAFGTIKSSLLAAGFSGHIFVAEQTMLNGVTNATVEAAQIALVDNTSIWSAGNMDALTGTNRQSDNTHWSDTGAPNAATAVYNAMHASGIPF